MRKYKEKALITVMVLLVVTTKSSGYLKEKTYKENVFELKSHIEEIEVQNRYLDLQLRATTDELKGVREEHEQLVKELEEQVVKLEERAKLPSVSRGSSLRPVSNDLTKPSGVTEERIEEVLKGTKLEGLAEYYIQAERDYGINAKFLVSLSIEESGWGKSNIAITKNNLFGFQAYTKNTSKASTFSSKGECILFVGKYIAENYLTEGGKHYNGVTVESVHKKYAENPKWARNIKSHMNRF